MATYPNNVLVKGDVINEVDVVDQNDHNILKGEIIALQTYVGTTPQGGFTDFASRVNRFLNGTGVVVNSTAFPADTTPLRLFYRTDAETLYIRRADNTAWQAVGASPSNVVYSWSGIDDADASAAGGKGIYYGTSVKPAMPGSYMGNLFYMSGATAGTYTMIRTKFNKIQGITTLIAYARIWARQTATNGVKIFYDINASAVVGTSGAVVSSAPTWASSSFDVSGLTNGTVYDFLIKISNEPIGPLEGYLSSVIVYGQ